MFFALDFPVLAVLYFGLQGVLVALCWAALFARPGLRRHFHPPGSPEADLMAFFPSDALLLVAGSWGVVWLLYRGSGWAGPVMWLVAGAFLYAAIYALVVSVRTRSAWVPVVMMVPGAVVSTLFAVLWAVANVG